MLSYLAILSQSIVSYDSLIVFLSFRHIFVLTNTGDVMTFDFCQNRPAADLEEASQ